MTALTADAIAGYAYTTGLRGDPLITSVAVALAESGGNSDDINDTPRTGDLSYGLWQINMYQSLGPARRKQFGISSNGALLDPSTNARAMYAISSGGSNWKPWSTYKAGAHRKYLTTATAAAKSVEARGGVTGGSSSSSIGAAVTPTISSDYAPPGGGLAPIAPVGVSFPQIATPTGGIATSLLERLGIQGHVAMSTSSVTEVTLTFVQARETGLWASFLLQAPATLHDLHLVVTDTAWGNRDGIETFQVTLQPAGVHKMREPLIANTWSNMSPTDVMRQVAGQAGLRFYGKGTAVRDQIVQLDADATGSSGRDTAESDWELGVRLAREEGFWFFECAGAIYFAPPTFLRDSAIVFPVRWGSGGAFDALDIPAAAQTVNAVRYAELIAQTVPVKLPRWRGEQVRPGMVMDYNSHPGFTGSYIVTEVAWDLDGGVTPVEVTAITPIDPIPQPAQDDTSGGLDDGTGADGTGTAGGNVSGGGVGSYGYQYDPPGNTASGKEQPGQRLLQNHLLAKFPGTHDDGIYVNRNVAGTSSPSAHKEGRAGDIGVPVSSALGDRVANYLVANAPLFGVQYIIWNARSWNATKRVWKTYTAPGGGTDVTALHKDHVHVELCWEAARNLNSTQLSAAVNG